MKNSLIVVGDPHLTDKVNIRSDNLISTHLSKWEQIYDLAIKRNAIIAATGDFCDSEKITNKMEKYFIDFKNHRYKNVEITTSFGNHDEFSLDPKRRDETSLGVLISSGVVKHYTGLNQEKPDFINLDYFDNIHEFMEREEMAPIVLGHIFYENEFYGGFNHNITEDMAKKMADKGVRHLVLGHDHKDYPIVKLTTEKGNSIEIHRPGSLLRKKTRVYNFKRNIKVIVFNKDLSYNYVSLEVPNFRDIITNEKVFERNNISDEDLEIMEEVSEEFVMEGLLDIGYETEFQDEEEHEDNVLNRIKSLNNEKVKDKIIQAIHKVS